uniref:DUF3741 domain-containing protein n=1 Tax=Kalanchoe fedtschenkoi TaxID=63787 RepID=A0A7N0U4L8_KALFE
MKLSSSNSTRSTASASFDDANIYCDGSGAAAGCIFSVLRRMLCSGSLPTHPSDHSSVAEERVSVCGRKEKRAVESSPGIVARLMGLDSMPERITRSRSLNSVDQIKAEGDEDGGIRLQGKKLHRRSKTSVSFRERPEFLELEDDEFIVLRFDDGDEKRSPGSSSELKQGRAKPRRNREEKDGERKQRKACEADAQARSIRTILQPAEPESDYMEAKSRRKQKQTSLAKKKKKEVASESDSEESSPVSIFDFYQPKTGQEAEQETETLVSADDDSWTRSSSSSSSSNSSRQSSPEPEPDKTKISQNDQKAEAEHQQQHALLSKTVAAVNGQKKNRKAWDRACSVAVAEISSAEWGVKDVGDAAAELQVHIMDQLFNDLITDLLQSSI